MSTDMAFKPRPRGARVRRIAGVLVVVTALLFVLTLLAPAHPKDEYFGIAAQVLPALLLVLALEGQVLHRMNAAPIERTQMIAATTVGMIIYSEMIVLFAVASGDGGRSTFVTTAATIAWSCGFILAPYLRSDAASASREKSQM